jgi:transcription antitermination factor NusG
VFLPKLDTWSRQRGVRRLVQVPMFAGYLFVGDVSDRHTHLEVLKARGVVRVLGERWDRLAPIPPDEIRSIQRITQSREPVFAHEYLRVGQRVRIIAGPLAGVEGILQRSRPHQGVIVVSVHLLQRSVAVAIDGVDVVPA